jgi:hypothetical protein
LARAYEAPSVDGLLFDAYGMDRQGHATVRPVKWGAAVWSWDNFLLWDSQEQTWPTRAAALKVAERKARELARAQMAQAA